MGKDILSKSSQKWTKGQISETGFSKVHLIIKSPYYFLLICICLFLLCRPALAMITDAENKKLITPGKVIDH